MNTRIAVAALALTLAPVLAEAATTAAPKKKARARIQVEGDGTPSTPTGNETSLPALPPLGPAMPGWDGCKWTDMTHQNPKYVVGRIISRFPHTTNGLSAAMPYIYRAYPGSKILPGKGDMLHIPCVGKVDLVVNAGLPSGGTAWAWGAYEESWNECNTRANGCPAEDLCEKFASKRCDGGRAGPGNGPSENGRGSGYLPPNTPPTMPGAPGGGTPPPTTPTPPTNPTPTPPSGPGPNPTPTPPGGNGSGGCAIPSHFLGVAQEVRGRPGMDEAFHRLCRHNTDWTYLDALVSELRSRGDNRWGYWCRRGNCGDPSHDVIAYYCGAGSPSEGAVNVSGMDFISASCYDSPADGPNPGLYNGEIFGSSGQRAWTGRGRF